MIAQTRQFLTEVNKEMKKVSWPTREQLRESTIVVITTTLLITTLVFVIDQLATQLMNLLF
ncbi:MAG: preprotein translocase subunit SecE [Bradyrhizobiaceae bacterium]|nr:preprotein translocase subunit SecE [Bradyrhizobiaceae bacterium]